MLNDSFAFCSGCSANAIDTCCNSFENIDNPWMTSQEHDLIMKRHSISFATKVAKNFYTLNTKKGSCIFYKGGCSIYDIRPLDCRLYPFDVAEKKGRIFLTKYKDPCATPSSGDEFYDKRTIAQVEILIDKMKSYIREYLAEWGKVVPSPKLAQKEQILIKEIL